MILHHFRMHDAGCSTSFGGVGVAVCASNAELIVVIKTKVKNFLSIVRGKPPPVVRRRRHPIKLCRYLAQQWPPEQHLGPAQQSARCDVRSRRADRARAIIIIKRYFMKVLLLNSISSRSLRERADAN
jgi:hypothetical protein